MTDQSPGAEQAPSSSPAEMMEAVEIVKRLRADTPGGRHYHDGMFVPDIDAIDALKAEAADAIEYLLSVRADAAREEWRPVEEADKRRGNLVGIWPCSVRWRLYHENAPEHYKRQGGRWQRAREHGGWENCDPPVLVRSLSSSAGGEKEI